MSHDGTDVYEPSAAECEALAKRFHPKFTWSMLHDHEKQGLIDEWRQEQAMREPPKQGSASPRPVSRVASEADLGRVVDTVARLVELQPLAAKSTAKASAHLVIRAVGKVLRPVITREQQQRADLQRDLALMRREWAEQSRRFHDLQSGLLAELCMHKRDENDERAQRLDDLEERVDAAIAELARR
jgi:hypothetical protein